MNKPPLVLILGATGLFGELLVKRLDREKQYSVVGGGRNLAALEDLKQETNINIVVVDRDSETLVAAVLEDLKPFAVVDCAGPFQYYGSDPYRFARQVLKAGCHYLDIADAGAFVVGISALDQLAKDNKLVAISGLSSTPAISGAAADKLCDAMSSVISIESAIIPGNRARRTLSVMKAILGQVGQPLSIHRFGKAETVYGWSETRPVNMQLPFENPIRERLASLIHAPDVTLFPDRYGAQTVTISAGLELKTFHRALQIGCQLVRLRLIRSLAPAATTLRWVASWFEQLGSDIGGMQVKVVGVSGAPAPLSDQLLIQRTWELVADDGRGPEIPTLPVSVFLDKLYGGEFEAGARASPGEISLEDLQSRFDQVPVATAIFEQPVQPMFKAVLGDAFDALPAPVRALHNNHGSNSYFGKAQSSGPSGISGRLVAWVVGFPKAGDDVPVEVTMTADDHGETWLRNFKGSKFTSHLSVDADGYVVERFGILTSRLGLRIHRDQLHFPVLNSKLFGILPLPRFLLPLSIAHETMDEQGRFIFDVLIKTPFGARIAHYRGWLSSRRECPAE